MVMMLLVAVVAAAVVLLPSLLLSSPSWLSLTSLPLLLHRFRRFLTRVKASAAPAV